MASKNNMMEVANHKELMDLAFKRLNKEFDSFKEQWNQAIANDPKALYGWMSYEYCLRADIIFYFEGNNDEPIPDDKLRAVINEPGNALDELVANTQWAVDGFTEDIRYSVLYTEYR